MGWAWLIAVWDWYGWARGKAFPVGEYATGRRDAPLASPRGCSLSCTRERARVRVFSSRKALRLFPSQPRYSNPATRSLSCNSVLIARVSTLCVAPHPGPLPVGEYATGRGDVPLGFAKELFPLQYSGEGQGEGLFEPQSFATLSITTPPLDPCFATLFSSHAFRRFASTPHPGPLPVGEYATGRGDAPLALPRDCSLSSTRERARVRVFSSRKALRLFPSKPGHPNPRDTLH